MRLKLCFQISFEYKKVDAIHNSWLKHIDRFKSSVKIRATDVEKPLKSSAFGVDIVPYKLPDNYVTAEELFSTSFPPLDVSRGVSNNN